MESKALTLTKKELDVLELTVRDGLQSFVSVGSALQEINNRRGYVLRGHKTFDEYCEQVFGFSRRHGYRMIAAAQAVEQVKAAIGDAPRNEAAARELIQVAAEPKLLIRVQAKLQKQGKSVATATAEQIGEVVRSVTAAKSPDKKEAEPVKPTMPVLTDVCPGCGKTPTGYFNNGTGWRCGQCDAQVMVGVIAAAPQACPTCGFAIVGGTGFCSNCGEVLA